MDREIKSPGIAFNWKLIKKKIKRVVVKSVNKQIKFVLISLTVKISEILPSSLITSVVGSTSGSIFDDLI